MLRALLTTSRPRFWHYLLGPYLLGAFAAIPSQATLLTPAFWLPFLFFTLPANLLVYGVNDLCDGDTDAFNTKKEGYERRVEADERRRLLGVIVLFCLPFLLAFVRLPLPALLALAAFFFFSVFYSAPPIRAKARPIVDAAFNVLYVFPGVFGYFALGGKTFALTGFLAAWAWCMAMHAFSAIPDIDADKAAGVPTVATLLGERGTLLFCGTLYTLAAALAFPLVGGLAAVAGALYVGLLVWAARTDLFAVYRRFPLLNGIVGFCLVWTVILARFF